MFKFISNLLSKPSAPSQEINPVQESETKNIENYTIALQGDLSVVTIENLMQLMSHARLSGELRLVAPDNDASFIIRNGALVFGHLKSNNPRLGERLVQEGYITTENLHECLNMYQKQGRRMRLGELLVTKQFISANHLEEIIKEQVKDCFFKVLSWESGVFSFSVNESPPEEDIILDERIDHLIIEGIVAIDQSS